MQTKLTESDFRAAAASLRCEPLAIEAFANIEAPRGFFNPDGTPVILFERHYFSRLTGGRYDESHPVISNPERGGYGLFKVQHTKLAEAAALDRDAALKSASWGGFQIMGANYARCGFPSLQRFINAMYQDAPAHLDAFVAFILADPALARALRNRDWHTAAERYNGAGQDAPPGKVNDYDYRIAQEYLRLVRRAA